MMKSGFCYHSEVTNYMRDEDIHIGDVMYKGNNDGICYHFSEKISWCVCSEMLEPYIDEEYYVATDEDINELLQAGVIR